MSIWKSGKPKQKHDEKCQEFFCLGKWSDSPSKEVFHFEENEFLDYDGNIRKMRLWMEIPEFPKYRDV